MRGERCGSEWRREQKRRGVESSRVGFEFEFEGGGQAVSGRGWVVEWSGDGKQGRQAGRQAGLGGMVDRLWVIGIGKW